MRFLIPILSGFMLASMLACQGSDLPQGQEKKSAALNRDADVTDGQNDTNPLNDILAKNANVLNAKYNVSVTAIFKNVCKGQMQFKIKTQPEQDGQLFDMPYGRMKCLGGLMPDIDMASMLSVSDGQTKDATSVEVADSVIRLKGLRQSVYQKPYRPFIPSFLSGTPEELSQLQILESVTVGDLRTNQRSQGTVSMRMLAFDVPYQSKSMPGVVFDKTLRFRVENKGFKDFDDRLGAMLFDVMEMTISMNPIAIVSMHFETKMKDLMKAGGQLGMFTGGPLGELLMGNAKVSIDIDMFDQQGLRAFMEQAKAMDGNP